MDGTTGNPPVACKNISRLHILSSTFPTALSINQREDCASHKIADSTWKGSVRGREGAVERALRDARPGLRISRGIQEVDDEDSSTLPACASTRRPDLDCGHPIPQCPGTVSVPLILQAGPGPQHDLFVRFSIAHLFILSSYQILFKFQWPPPLSESLVYFHLYSIGGEDKAVAHSLVRLVI
mgnify:CR=1 FL=1